MDEKTEAGHPLSGRCASCANPNLSKNDFPQAKKIADIATWSAGVGMFEHRSCLERAEAFPVPCVTYSSTNGVGRIASHVLRIFNKRRLLHIEFACSPSQFSIYSCEVFYAIFTANV